MRKLNEFSIDFVKLENDSYQYEYVIDNDFFELFEGSIIQKGKLQAVVTLSKSESMLVMDFHIKGTVELICDRSLEEFDYQLDCNRKLIAKFSDHNEELSDELILIDKELADINVAQYIYEFIGLEIPIKKLHPRFVKEDDDSDEDILIYTSSSESAEEEKDTDEDIDPRWEALKKLNKNKK